MSPGLHSEMRWFLDFFFFYLSPGRGHHKQGHKKPRENQHGYSRPVTTTGKEEEEDEKGENIIHTEKIHKVKVFFCQYVIIKISSIQVIILILKYECDMPE